MTNLLVQTAFLGDLLLSIPLMKQIKQFDPEVSLSLYCRNGLGDVFLQLGLVDEVFEVDKSGGSSNSQNHLTEIKQRKWKTVYCPHESVRSALFVRSLTAQKKLGYLHWWNSLFFDSRIPRPLHLPEALRQLSLFTLNCPDFKKRYSEYILGWEQKNQYRKTSYAYEQEDIQPPWARLSVKDHLKGLPLTKERARVRELIPALSRLLDSKGQGNIEAAAAAAPIFMAPGSVWPTKRWSLEGYISLANRLSNEGHSIVLIGSSEEKALGEEICQRAPKALSLIGQTSLIETLLLLSQGKLLICNDSGAMHLACAVELPVVSVFGPTTLDLGYQPWGKKCSVIQEDLSCRPCGKHGSKICPLRTHDCMNRISTDHVYKYVLKLL